jgi:hypothetical protein
MAQGNGALQMLWIERPPLAAANTASIHQGGGTCPVSIRLMGGVNLVDRWNQAP